MRSDLAGLASCCPIGSLDPSWQVGQRSSSGRKTQRSGGVGMVLAFKRQVALTDGRHLEAKSGLDFVLVSFAEQFHHFFRRFGLTQEVAEVFVPQVT